MEALKKYLRSLAESTDYDGLINIRNKSEIDNYTLMENDPRKLFDLEKSEIVGILSEKVYAPDDEYAVLYDDCFEKTISKDELKEFWLNDKNIEALAKHIVENDLFEKCDLDIANY